MSLHTRMNVRHASTRMSKQKNPYYRPSASEKNKEDGFKDFPMDLQRMVIDRSPPFQLKRIAQVKKAWRNYVEHGYSTKNIRKINRRRVDSIHIKKPGHVIAGTKKILFFVDILHYSCGMLIIDKMDHGNMDQLTKNFQRIPDWWIQSVKKIRLYYNMDLPNSPAKLIEQFTNISELILRFEEIEHVHSYIRNMTEINKITLSFCHDSSDPVLEAIIERSQTHPLEFPRLDSGHTFTIAKIIRFLTHNNFPHASCHVVRPQRLLGRRDVLENWIRENTTPPIRRKPSLNTSRLIQRDYHFAYRGMEFLMLVNNFGW